MNKYAKYIFLGLFAVTCYAEQFDQKMIGLTYDSKAVEVCKFLGDLDNSKFGISFESHLGEPIVLGPLNGWKYQAYLLGGNRVDIQRVYLEEDQEYESEMGGFFRTSAHDDNRIILYPKAYKCNE